LLLNLRRTMMAHIRSSVDASEILQTYPLYFSRGSLDLCDIGKHRDDVLRKAQDLFLEESTGIKLDVREQLPGSSQHDTACAHSVPTNAAKFGSTTLLSTEKDAIAVLKVSKYVYESARILLKISRDLPSLHASR
jgi:hypothetical protein